MRPQTHEVNVVSGSMINQITGSLEGEVNCAHHQSVDAVGEGLVVAARADDGIVEGLERAMPEGKPFFLLVQWHPERMNNQNSPFTKNIRDRFIEEIGKKKFQS